MMGTLTPEETWRHWSLSFGVAWTPERMGRLTLRITRCLSLWVRKFLNHPHFIPISRQIFSTDFRNADMLSHMTSHLWRRKRCPGTEQSGLRQAALCPQWPCEQSPRHSRSPPPPTRQSPPCPHWSCDLKRMQRQSPVGINNPEGETFPQTSQPEQLMDYQASWRKRRPPLPPIRSVDTEAAGACAPGRVSDIQEAFAPRSLCLNRLFPLCRELKNLSSQTPYRFQSELLPGLKGLQRQCADGRPLGSAPGQETHSSETADPTFKGSIRESGFVNNNLFPVSKGSFPFEFS